MRTANQYCVAGWRGESGHVSTTCASQLTSSTANDELWGTRKPIQGVSLPCKDRIGVKTI